MKDFVCSKCGKKHKLFLGMELPLPKLIREMPEEEKTTRVKSNGNLYLLDDKWFLLKGKIVIPINELNKGFKWIVWIKLPKGDFLSNIKPNQQEVRDRSYLYRGSLESSLPYYEDSYNSKVQFMHTDDPLLNLEMIEESELRIDQLSGITLEKAITVMEQFFHSQFNI